MRIQTLLGLASLFLLVGLGFGLRSDASPEHDLKSLISAAAQGDLAAAETLRDMGPTGLAAFVDTHRNSLTQCREEATAGAVRLGIGGRWRHLVQAMDVIAGQRDAAWSELYWFTNREQAKEEAQRTGKPILSLRLLGRLDEEFSCANSRLFRAVLYPDARVGEILSERFVLHWESVRPAPRITIDYGDGRKIETTITGNSIHYVLTPEGSVVDALPGLWTPQAFADALETAEAEALRLAGVSSSEFTVSAREFWDQAIQSIDEKRLALGVDQAPQEDGANFAPGKLAPVAAAAAMAAASKGVMELPMLGALSRFNQANREAGEAVRWAELAGAMARREVVMDTQLLRAMLAQGPSDPNDSGITRWNLHQTMLMDSLRNELDLRRQILRMLAMYPELSADLQQLNSVIYRAIFLTPDSDPWLGLREPNVFEGFWVQ